MKQFEQLSAKVNELRQKAAPYLEKADKGYQKAKHIWEKAKPWIWASRKILLSIPVVWLMLYFARLNWNVLPEQVGLNLQTTGEFAKTISRQTAVTFPLFLTGGCLVLTFLSKKSLYPWLISIFSLVIPIMLLITNMYPA